MKKFSVPSVRRLNPENWRLRVFLLVLVILALELVWMGWPFSLAYLRTQNPSQTSMMKFRENQARTQHRTYHLRQQWVPLESISPWLQKAVVAAEDDTFYQHAGVDFDDLWESVKDDWKHRRYARGGSSLTQQVAKNLFLSPKKMLSRKIKEFFLAFRLDRALGKKRVLEIYLNIAEWGPGLFGAEAAARVYFHKPAAELNLDEALALAAVLPSPLKHSPLQTGRYVSWRKAWILGRMQRAGLVPAAAPPAEPATPEWVASEEEGEEAGEPAVAGEPAQVGNQPEYPATAPVPDALGTTPGAGQTGEPAAVTPTAP